MSLNNALFFGGTSEIAKEISNNLKKSFEITSVSRKKSGNKNYSKEIQTSFEGNNFPQKKLKQHLSKKFSLVIFFQASQPNYDKKFYEISNFHINKVINVNAVFSAKATTFLIEKNLLEKSCKIIYFSSRSGSIYERGLAKHHKPGGNNLYRASKSILNSFIKNIFFEFKLTNYIFISYHPGWVKTKSSGNSKKALSKKFVANKFMYNLKKFNLKHSGNFIDYNLKKILW